MSKSDWGKKQHPYIPELAEQLRKQEIDRREFLRTATLLGVAAPAAYAMAASITGQPIVKEAKAQAAVPKKGGMLRMSMRCQEMTDPAKFDWTEKSNVARSMVEYMVVTGVDNVTRPYLAQGWEASPDLKTWTFKLRQGIKWSNGDEFNADDVVHNFTRWLDPKIGSSNLGLFDSMVTQTDTGKVDDKGKKVISKAMTAGAVEKVDAHTVRLHLNRPELSIPENLYNYPTAIVHRKFDDMGANLSKNPIGTGPFSLKEFSVGQKIVLAKRSGYWGDEPLLDGITYVDHGDDPAAGLSALASGQVDSVHEAFVEQIDVVKKIPNVVLYEAITAQTAVARMQVDKKPYSDKRIRQAVLACIDHPKLLEVAYRGRGAVAEDHHVAPIHPEYFKLPAQKQDYALAKKLLADAGYPNGIDLKIDLKKEPPWELAACQAIAEICKPAGIRINLNVLPSTQYWEIWDKTDFGFTGWTHRPLGVMVLSLAYRSGVPWNETHYNNPTFDKALDVASATLDANERRKQMEFLEKTIQDDGIIAQALWRSIFSASHERVKDYKLHPTNYHQLSKVWLA